MPIGTNVACAAMVTELDRIPSGVEELKGMAGLSWRTPAEDALM